jgi:hypothetical protein
MAVEKAFAKAGCIEYIKIWKWQGIARQEISGGSLCTFY